MQLHRTAQTSHDRASIPVEFVVLHYTAETLEETLRLFLDPEATAGAHLVIDVDGGVHEITPCLNGTVERAHHAGRSRWTDHSARWDRFNDFSIGIELVNLNGNWFDYSDAQYESLQEVIRHLRDLYPSLTDPARIVGHEQIAGWRGKADPGARFDWPRFFEALYPGLKHPERRPVCGEEILDRLAGLARAEPRDPEDRHLFWRSVSWFLEHTVSSLQAAAERSSRTTPS